MLPARLAASIFALATSILAPIVVAQNPVPGTPLEKRVIPDSLGRSVTYYVGRPKEGRAPILLMIQGSGCMPVINFQPLGGTYSTLFNLVPYAGEGRFTVIAVEKPFADGEPGQKQGTAQSCGAPFNEDFTAERWLVALQSALADARKGAWVDPARTLVMGFSEGAVMASMLAARDERVTDVISIGGSGTTQLFDFAALAYQRCFDRTLCLKEVEDRLTAIRASPDSTAAFAWGHPFKRWTSFLAVDPSAELLRAKARVYVAIGTADESVPALSQEVLVARLLAAGRDVTVRRVANAGHTMAQPGDASFADLDREMRAALDWFWQPGPK